MPAPLVQLLRRNLSTALRANDLPQAADLLLRLQQEEPLALETRGLELEYLIRSGRLDEAGHLAAQLIELYPESGRIHYLAGWLAYRRRDYPRAVGHFRESLRIHPHRHTRHRLGKALTQAGQFDEAEALLLALMPELPACRLDLAWLYERRGEPERAIAQLEAHLAHHPGDPFAQQQLRRLQARTLAPEELQGEVELLLELGEEVPAELLPEYLESLLRTGRGRQARDFIAARAGALDHRAAASLAWVCHRLQAYDLAFELFLKALPAHLGNFKFLNALEAAAERCARLDTLIAEYEARAPEERRLYGRIKGLQKRLGR